MLIAWVNEEELWEQWKANPYYYRPSINWLVKSIKKKTWLDKPQKLVKSPKNDLTSASAVTAYWKAALCQHSGKVTVVMHNPAPFSKSQRHRCLPVWLRLLWIPQFQAEWKHLYSFSNLRCLDVRYGKGNGCFGFYASILTEWSHRSYAWQERVVGLCTTAPPFRATIDHNLTQTFLQEVQSRLIELLSYQHSEDGEMRQASWEARRCSDLASRCAIYPADHYAELSGASTGTTLTQSTSIQENLYPLFLECSIWSDEIGVDLVIFFDKKMIKESLCCWLLHGLAYALSQVFELDSLAYSGEVSGYQEIHISSSDLSRNENLDPYRAEKEALPVSKTPEHERFIWHRDWLTEAKTVSRTTSSLFTAARHSRVSWRHDGVRSL